MSEEELQATIDHELISDARKFGLLDTLIKLGIAEEDEELDDEDFYCCADCDGWGAGWDEDEDEY